MKAAVIGLGVEGKKAVNSLLNHGWEVYATDLNINVDLEGLNLRCYCNKSQHVWRSICQSFT